MIDFAPPFPPVPVPDPPIVPLGTVLTRIILAGGLEAVQAVIALLADDEESATRLLSAVEGIYPDDASARALIEAAGLDPDIILAHPDVTPE